jgi:hypothetical protein
MEYNVRLERIRNVSVPNTPVATRNISVPNMRLGALKESRHW